MPAFAAFHRRDRGAIDSLRRGAPRRVVVEVRRRRAVHARRQGQSCGVTVRCHFLLFSRPVVPSMLAASASRSTGRREPHVGRVHPFRKRAAWHVRPVPEGGVRRTRPHRRADFIRSRAFPEATSPTRAAHLFVEAFGECLARAGTSGGAGRGRARPPRASGRRSPRRTKPPRLTGARPGPDCGAANWPGSTPPPRPTGTLESVRLVFFNVRCVVYCVIIRMRCRKGQRRHNRCTLARGHGTAGCGATATRRRPATTPFHRNPCAWRVAWLRLWAARHAPEVRPRARSPGSSSSSRARPPQAKRAIGGWRFASAVAVASAAVLDVVPGGRGPSFPGRCGCGCGCAAGPHRLGAPGPRPRPDEADADSPAGSGAHSNASLREGRGGTRRETLPRCGAPERGDGWRREGEDPSRRGRPWP